MNANKFESMVNHVIAYIDGHNITKSIRDIGFNVCFKTWIKGNESSGYVYATLRIGLEGIPSSYITVFDETVNPYITKTDLFRIYKPALGNLHRFAVNKRYGLNCYMPASIVNTIMDTARLTCLPYNEALNLYRRIGSLEGGIYSNSAYAGELFKNYIKEDTDMMYTLMHKPTGRGEIRWLAPLEPEKIHFNGPATVVEWNDGSKTVVKCQRGDTFDPLTGVAMCCMKKMLGTNESGSNYLNDVSKLIDEAWEAKNKRYERKEKKEKK